MRQIDLRCTTTAGGVGAAVAEAFFGRLVAVEWVDGDLADGVDAVLKVTKRKSGVDRTLLTLTDANNDAFYYPREQVHGNTGAGLTYDGTRTINEMPLIDGVLSLAIADGGAAKTGGMIVYVE